MILKLTTKAGPRGGIEVVRDAVLVGTSKFDIHGCLITLTPQMSTWDEVWIDGKPWFVLPPEYRTARNN